MRKICGATAVALFLLCVNSSFAQKKKPVSKPVTNALVIKNLGRDDLPTFDKAGLLVTLSSDGKAKVELLSNWSENAWTLNALSPVTEKTSVASVIVIEAEPDLSFETLKPWLDRLRGSGKPRLKLRTADMDLLVPSKLSDRVVRPNPLFLAVTVGENGALDLNGEPHGRMTDPQTLSKKLRDIFKAREDNGVLRIGENDIDTTVFIKPSASMKLREIEALAHVIRDAGSDRIGILIGSGEKIELIQMIQSSQK